MNLSLSIERLILEGIPLEPEALPELQRSFAAELGRLLEQGSLDPGLQANGAAPQRRGGSFELEATGSPARLGRQAARAVYASLSAPEEPARPFVVPPSDGESARS